MVFVLFSTVMCWFMFAPIYKHVLIVRQAVLQKEVDYLLEIGANGMHGYIDQTMVDESRQRMEQRGFVATELIYTVSTSTGAVGTNPSLPVERGVGIRLNITYPYHHLFAIDALIGIAPPSDGSRMGAAGIKMSEFVPRV